MRFKRNHEGMFKYTYMYINYLNINIGKIQNASNYSKNLNTLENGSFTDISLGINIVKFDNEKYSLKRNFCSQTMRDTNKINR